MKPLFTIFFSVLLFSIAPAQNLAKGKISFNQAIALLGYGEKYDQFQQLWLSNRYSFERKSFREQTSYTGIGIKYEFEKSITGLALVAKRVNFTLSAFSGDLPEELHPKTSYARSVSLMKEKGYTNIVTSEAKGLEVVEADFIQEGRKYHIKLVYEYSGKSGPSTIFVSMPQTQAAVAPVPPTPPTPAAE